MRELLRAFSGGGCRRTDSCRFSDSLPWATGTIWPSKTSKLGPNVTGMSSSFELLQSRERLRVGQRFLRLRPRIAGVAALGNAALLLTSAAPAAQKAALGLAFVATIGAFFAEAFWLARRPLTEAWLFGSLALTLLALSVGATLSGGLTSPILPLLFAPAVVGFAAFARARQSWLLLAETVALFLLLGGLAPLTAFPELPPTALRGMLAVSSAGSLVLLAVGVIGLVDAHARIAAELDRLRTDMLQEAELRASSVEHLGAQVAHEVKNPLTAARGLVQLVERHVADERDKQRLAVVVTEVDRALAVLQDYLSFARPLSDLKLAAVRLLPLLEDAAGVLEARALEKGLTVRISGEDLEVWGDRQRLRDALLNLLLNAITALPRGGKIELLLARSGASVHVTISDDGPGLSPELLGRLGQPFVTASEGGTGLGVMLAESVLRQHGGALRIESEPGKGVRALLELPLGVARPHAEAS
jgi:signal transduction histidine kinase